MYQAKSHNERNCEMGLFGGEDKLLKQARKIAAKVEALKPKFKGMSDAELKSATEGFRSRVQSGESLDDLLPEVFAQVREASWRVLEMEHFNVQIIGGIILHQGCISEMKTGEGKTLVATLPACLNALAGSVHIVTVNEYLAKRDSEWMGKLYKFLGYSVGLIAKDMSPEQKKQSYAADIIYATNNELGFDYLRDNMAIYKERMVQGSLNYAIIDEVDSILVAEARTPLIISGQGDKSTELYALANSFALTLKDEEHYVLDEKLRTVNLTEEGNTKAERHFGVENLSDIENTELNHHILQALKANTIMKRDIDYVVQNDEVVIVDEFTGRLMTGRRYSEGLHQAIEAKEGVKIARESKTLATITFQNLFRMYKKLSGMTGTAKTEENEFSGIYGLNVVQIPTNRPNVRKDLNDIVYPTIKGKFAAVVEEIEKVAQSGQPILVGTVSVEKSEVLSAMLKKRGVKHEVLNAKYHEKEALIVAQAGKFGQVTIATNMAGRGTDILLGGNPDFLSRTKMRNSGFEEEMIVEATSHAETTDEEVLNARRTYNELYANFKKETDVEHDKVVAAGGLYIIGTERHESRRIDNQLRGRAGRQGDPGASRFYVALEDDLMRLFGGERIKGILDKLSGGEDIPIEYGIMTKQIEKAQMRIEQRNFDMRSNVLKYDDVMNSQREIIYSQRRSVLEGADVHDSIVDMLDSIVSDECDVYCPSSQYPEEWDIEAFERQLREIFLPPEAHIFEDTDITTLTAKEATDRVKMLARKHYENKCEQMTEAGVSMAEAERVLLLRNVDEKWMNHIDSMDQLRQGIGLRAYGNTDPILAYRKEGFDMFEEMVDNVRTDTLKMLFHLTVTKKVERKEVAKPSTADVNEPSTPRKADKKISRNAPCPCGSGKKYKQCCGQ